MDEDFGFDDTIGKQTYDFSQLKVGEPVHHTFQFGEVMKDSWLLWFFCPSFFLIV